MQELPMDAWDRFQQCGKAEHLLEVMRTLPHIPKLMDVEYPEYHRICDVELLGEAFRVSRLVALDDGRERLFIEPTDVPDFALIGVPYRLRGEALIRWVRDEIANPTDDEIDWGLYCPVEHRL